MSERISVCADYTTFSEFELPDGRTWHEANDYYIENGIFYVKWDDADEWEELGECAGIHDEPDNIEVSVDEDEDEQQDAA